MAESIRLFAPEIVRRQIAAVLRAWGMDEEKLAIVAETMLETDLRGIDSHGISMLILYEQMHSAGQLDLRSVPKVVRESATTALIDGGAGLGHPVARHAMTLAIEKALVSDIAVVSVFNSHHFGAAGIYAEMAAQRGLIGIASTTSRIVTVVPTFGAERRLGTNPFAFAAPARRNRIVLLDMSTSVVAANKVKVYALRGKNIPAAWVTDSNGEALTDSNAAYRLLFEGNDGGLSPMGGAGTEAGGHKGYGLAIFAQILSGTLGGGSFSPIRNRTQKPSDPDNIGHFFQVINPAAFRPLEEFQDDLDDLVDVLRNTRPARADQPVLIPGDPEWTTRDQRLAAGIPIPASLVAKLREIAGNAGAEFVLE